MFYFIIYMFISCKQGFCIIIVKIIIYDLFSVRNVNKNILLWACAHVVV
jgi:hypothetical protein